MNSFVQMYRRVKEKLHKEIPKFSETNHNKNIIFTRNTTTFSIEYGLRSKIRFFINHSDFKSGDWLEYYTYYSLMKKGNSQLKMGVKLINDIGVENEIDVIELRDYKLSLYSCKTGKKDNQFDLYEIETLRNIISGTFGRGFFVTSNTPSSKFLKRAEELNIKVINILEQSSSKIFEN
jgi:glycogen synthase